MHRRLCTPKSTRIFKAARMWSNQPPSANDSRKSFRSTHDLNHESRWNDGSQQWSTSEVDSWRSYRNDTTNLQQLAGFAVMQGYNYTAPFQLQTPFHAGQYGMDPVEAFYQQQQQQLAYAFQHYPHPTAASLGEQQSAYVNKHGLNPTASPFQPVSARSANSAQTCFTPYQSLRTSNGQQERMVVQQTRSKSTIARKRGGRQHTLHTSESVGPMLDIQDVAIPSIEHNTQYSSIPIFAPNRNVDASKQFRTRPSSPSPSPPPAPTPTSGYMSQASLTPVGLSTPRKLLVVLDLNGTLLKRRQASGTSFVLRPGVTDFVKYLFANHVVMVYSSARPENTQGMVHKIFHPSQREQLAAVWARDKLDLTRAQYFAKVQVYKRLEKIWASESIQSRADEGKPWDQTNTVLVDDSHLKALAQPYNLLKVEEFLNDKPSGPVTSSNLWVAKQEQIVNDLQNKLEELKWTADVTQLIRTWQLVNPDKQQEYVNDQSLELEHDTLQLLTPKSSGVDTATPEVFEGDDSGNDGSVSPIDEAVWKEILEGVEPTKDEPQTPKSLTD